MILSVKEMFCSDRLENVNENVNSNHQCEESIRMTVESSVDPFNSSSSEINSNIV